jgi:hypothetical protein
MVPNSPERFLQTALSGSYQTALSGSFKITLSGSFKSG